MVTQEEQFKRFTKKLDELNSIIGEGIGYFHAWRSMGIESEDTVEALNRYKGFFVPALHALRQMSLLQLAKLFDKNSRTVSFRNLLTEARTNRQLLMPFATEHDLDEIEQQINANSAIVDAVKALRDQRLAHHDAELQRSDPIEYGKVIQLIADVESIYNAFRRGHDRSYWSFGQIRRGSEQHTKKVVQMVMEDKDRARAEVEKAMEGLRRDPGQLPEL